MSDPKIEVGQVWVSRDPRDAGRTVTVERIDAGFIYVRSVRLSRVRRENLARYYRPAA